MLGSLGTSLIRSASRIAVPRTPGSPHRRGRRCPVVLRCTAQGHSWIHRDASKIHRDASASLFLCPTPTPDVPAFAYRLMCPAPSSTKPRAKGRVRRRAPQGPDPAWFQIVRVRHHPAVRTGDHLRCRSQWIRQIQCGGRALLGHGGTGRQIPARRQDGRRDLRRYDRAAPARPRRSIADHRQFRRRIAHRVRRSDDHSDHVPQWRQRIPDQWRHLPAARHPGTPLRLRHRPRDARHRRAGPVGLRAARRPDGPPRLHRGGRGRPQAPQAQGEGAAEAGRDGRQPGPGPGPH